MPFTATRRRCSTRTTRSPERIALASRVGADGVLAPWWSTERSWSATGTGTSGRSPPARSNAVEDVHRLRGQGLCCCWVMAACPSATTEGKVLALDRAGGGSSGRTAATARSTRPDRCVRPRFIGSLDDGVYAFGAATGHLLWSRPTGSYVYASPAVADGRVLVGSYDHRFYALDAGTGVAHWSFDGGDRISGAASVIGRRRYFSTFGERTFALNVKTGKRVHTWSDGKYSHGLSPTESTSSWSAWVVYALTAAGGTR